MKFSLTNTTNLTLRDPSPKREKTAGFTLKQGKVDFTALKYDLNGLFLDKHDEVKAQATSHFDFGRERDQN